MFYVRMLFLLYFVWPKPSFFLKNALQSIQQIIKSGTSSSKN
uniref:Uncharacterized protein n=1 Tax=Meloidogyne enterolobii TaxID=390850 RepID=A0A6V7TXI0_MELEN|nr:unnamed protein product [Meloidogyne enterolobii]